MGTYADSSKQFLNELVRLTKYNLIAADYEKLSIDGTVKSLTVPSGVNYALITVESSIATPAIRYLELGGSGTQPSTTDGLAKSNLDTFDVHGYQNLVNFRVTRVAAGTHTLHIQYYK